MWIKQPLSTHPISTRDTVITCLVNTATCLLAGTVTFSILGHMAHNQGVDVASVSIILLAPWPTFWDFTVSLLEF